MNEPERTGAARAAELRRAFDGAFARPVRPDRGDAREDVLMLRAGADVAVVRLSQMQGLLARPNIVAVPGPQPELLGIAVLRGALVPVYSLAALQGQPSPEGAPSWMLLVKADGLVGLAFEEMLGYARLDQDEITALPKTDGATTVAAQTARVGDALRPLIDVPSLVEALKQRAGVVGAHRQE